MAKTKIKDKTNKNSEGERKKVKEEIRHAVEKWQQIFNSISDFIFIQDKNFKIVKANKTFCDALKTKPEDLIGKKCYKVLHKSNKPWPNCPFVKVLKDKRAHSEEVCDPNIGIPLLVTTSPLFDEKGKLTGAVHITKDISGRKQAEEELRNLSKFPEENPSPLYRVSRDGTLLYANLASRRLILEDQTKIGDKIPKKWIGMIRDAYDSGKRQRAEIELSGRVFLFELVPVIERGYVNSYAIDITEREKAEEDLKRAYRSTREMLEKAPFGIYLVNSKGDIAYVNPAMVKIAGDSYDQFRKLNVFNLPSYKRIGLDNKIKSVLKGKSFFMGPVEYASYYGEKITVRNFIGIPLGEGAEREALIFVEDVSELKKAEEDLMEAQKYLLQSEKMVSIGRLATGIAHEIKNPLATILQGVEYLEENAQTANRKKSLVLGYIKDAVSRSNSIINELLDFSVVSKMQIKKENLNSVLEKALFLVKYQLGKNRIQLIKDFRTNIPSIKIDKNKIQQAFINIFMNAIQAMPKGGELKVNTYAEKPTKHGNGIGRRKDDNFRLGELAAIAEIEDTGPGISKDILDKIFDPFFTTKTVKGRIGMGLSIVRGIIKGHDGLLKAEKQEGRPWRKNNYYV